VFGAKRLPEIGRSLGSGMREFKDSVTGERQDSAQQPPALTQATQQPPEAPVAQPAATPAAPPAQAPAEPTHQA
jgi:sec-independent protein translocase protein TatA